MVDVAFIYVFIIISVFSEGISVLFIYEHLLLSIYFQSLS